MKRKFALGFIIATLLLLCGISVSAETDGTYIYTIENGEATITGVVDKSSFSGKQVIPNTIDGYLVTSTGRGAFEDCSELTDISIPNGVTTIGNSAFEYCSSLTSISIPNSVTSIGDCAFSACFDLTEVHISNISAWCNIDFEYFGANPLSYAHNLYLNNTLVEDLVIPDNVINIKPYTFYNYSCLTSVSIPNSVKSIGEYAFSRCNSLTNVTIPNSVTSIGDNAFINCSSLTSISIPNSITSIGSCAFDGCSGLTEVHISNISAWCNIDFEDNVANPLWYAHSLYLNNTLVEDLVIPDNVINIKPYAFYNCSCLTSVSISNSVKSIEKGAFGGCSGLTSITIPDGVTSIGNSAFSDCKCLTSVKIPDSVISIGAYAFYGCYRLISVEIPDSVTSIENYTFYDCYRLTSAKIGNGVISIGDNAFDDCSALASINIPSSVTSIGNSAFDGCTELTSVTIPNSVTSIGTYAFYNCSKLSNITIPDSITSIGFRALDGTAWYNKNKYGVTVVYAGKVAYKCTVNEYNVSIKLRNDTIAIAGCAFDGFYGLTSVTIPDGVTNIGDYAFRGCTRLTSITIPDSVTHMGYGAFSSCNSLQEVHISNLSAWCNIDFETNIAYNTHPLYYANKLYLNNTLVKDLVIPNNVTTIKPYAFYYCTGLTSVTIPDSVTGIGENAFYNCNNLKTVYTAKSHKWQYDFGNNVQIINISTVNFIGDYTETHKVEEGQYAILPTPPTGYIYTYTVNGKAWDGSEPITEDITVTVTKTQITYNVKFIGDYVDEQTVKYNGYATLATEYGYTYSYVANGKVWNNEPITADITITVTKTPIIYQVIFIGDYKDTQTVEYGKNAILPTAPKHSKYIFTVNGKAWNNEPITADITITVMKTPITSQVRFIGDYEDTKTVEYGKNAILPTAPKYSKYTFTVNGKPWDGKNITDNVTVNVKLTEFEVSPQYCFNDDGKCYYKFNLKSSNDFDTTAIIALYDINGKLLDILSKDASLTSTYQSITAKPSVTDAVEYKVFLWENLQIMTPVCEAFCGNIEN